ncbi:MAG: hypothetical protein LAP39_00360 [Acidobacteriia bacterium]|nr:hypothetical protein [Terriglobia bacterium]
MRKYNHGQGDPYSELFHEHFPGHRISEEASIEMMKALVLRYEEVEASYILRCYLNKRGREPESYDPFRITVEYPEAGVIRKYCGTNIQAWLDTVIAPQQFRQLIAKTGEILQDTVICDPQRKR